MPLLMIIAEWRWLKTKEEVYLTLAKRWAKGTAILFAVGAVSGTVLSFELGLLFPKFMGYAGAIIGMPFSLEGFAFFTKAIFPGIYLYGWQCISPKAHIFVGAVVALGGAASGIFVVIANAWMNAPTGFRLVDGKMVDINPAGRALVSGVMVGALALIVFLLAETGAPTVRAGISRSSWALATARPAVGIVIEALRFYERSGLLGIPARTASGYRAYDAGVINRLTFIRKAQTLGFSLDEIRRIIAESKAGESPCEEVREVVRQRLV